VQILKHPRVCGIKLVLVRVVKVNYSGYLLMVVKSCNAANDSLGTMLFVLCDQYVYLCLVSDNTAKGIRGTPGYIAPEILEFQGTEQYTNKVTEFLST